MMCGDPFVLVVRLVCTKTASAAAVFFLRGILDQFVDGMTHALSAPGYEVLLRVAVFASEATILFVVGDVVYVIEYQNVPAFIMLVVVADMVIGCARPKKPGLPDEAED